MAILVLSRLDSSRRKFLATEQEAYRVQKDKEKLNKDLLPKRAYVLDDLERSFKQ